MKVFCKQKHLIETKEGNTDFVSIKEVYNLGEENRKKVLLHLNIFLMTQLTPKRILLAGLLAGTLDITGACIQYFLKTGKGPAGVLKFVASGLFGKEAFTGGAFMIIAGLVIHFLIAMTFTLFFYLLIKNIVVLRANRLVTGLPYGAFVWVVMNKLVLPLTKAPALKHDTSGDLQAMGILIVCIGLPLAFLLIRKPIHKTVL